MDRQKIIEKSLRYAEVTEPFVARMLREYEGVKAEAPMIMPDFTAPRGTPARHPADIVFTECPYYYGWEVKHDGTSNRTGNIFVERNALVEVKAFCDAVIYFSYRDKKPLIHHYKIEKLLEVAKEQGHFVADAGDTAKGMRGNPTPGWILPCTTAEKHGKRMVSWEGEWELEMMRHEDIVFAQPPEPTQEEMRKLLREKYTQFKRENK